MTRYKRMYRYILNKSLSFHYIDFHLKLKIGNWCVAEKLEMILIHKDISNYWSPHLSTWAQRLFQRIHFLKAQTFNRAVTHQARSIKFGEIFIATKLLSKWKFITLKSNYVKPNLWNGKFSACLGEYPFFVFTITSNV